MELKSILIRLRKGHSIKKIHKDTGTHRTIIRQLRKIAIIKNWLENEASVPTEKEIYETYHEDRKEEKQHPLEPYHDELKRYLDSGYSYVVMHSLISDRLTCSESMVRRYVQARIKKFQSKAIVKRERELSVMEVDFGRLGIMYDCRERRNRVVYIFSGRLRYSAKAYRAIVLDQKQETFWECHIRAFEYFGGVPERVVPDNLKAAVVKASFTDPVVNRGYRELAEHYDFLIDPCLPYHPQHKGGVESDIKYTKKNFLPIFQEKQRQMGREISHVIDCERELRIWEGKTADVRIIKSMGTSPNELFNHEIESLKMLPSQRFETPVWKKCHVDRRSRINVDRSTYTVPDRFIGKDVYVAAASKVRVFYESDLITEHQRASRPYQDVSKPEHLSENTLAYMEHTKNRLATKASSIGSSVHKIVCILLEDKAVSNTASCRGIISLAKKYGNARVNAACARALEFDLPRYSSVKRILKKNLDTLDKKDPVDSHGQRLFTFARVASYFNILPKNNKEQKA